MNMRQVRLLALVRLYTAKADATGGRYAPGDVGSRFLDVELRGIDSYLSHGSFGNSFAWGPWRPRDGVKHRG